MNAILGEVYRWYIKNERNLPWRQTTDSYKIWISEIILQQTRVAQGTNYYNRFIEKFPTVEKLANSTEDEVLKMWQGLGYYSRARNLHSAAKSIVNNYNGKFPDTYDEIIKLKGVGKYTAAAVASIAFDLPYPAIDGNIYRFFTRYFGISTPVDSQKGKNEIQKIASDLMPDKNAGFHNQAFMEFGALQCVPKSPKCEICPLFESCFAAQNKLVKNFPVKTKKAKQIHRYFYYYFIESGKFTYLEKRIGNDIWRNLYQFPLFESDKLLSEKEILGKSNIPFFNNCTINVKNISNQKKHILSHQIIFARVINIEIEYQECLSNNFIQVNKKDISKFAVPKLLEDFINELVYEENKD